MSEKGKKKKKAHWCKRFIFSKCCHFAEDRFHYITCPTNTQKNSVGALHTIMEQIQFITTLHSAGNSFHQNGASIPKIRGLTSFVLGIMYLLNSY